MLEPKQIDVSEPRLIVTVLHWDNKWLFIKIKNNNKVNDLEWFDINHSVKLSNWLVNIIYITKLIK